MATDSSARGGVIGKKAPYIRPAVPLKWEKKRPGTSPSIRQQPAVTTPEPVYDANAFSNINILENKSSTVADRDSPTTRDASAFDENSHTTSVGASDEEPTVNHEHSKHLINQNIKTPAEEFFEESEKTQNIISREGTTGGVAPDTDTDGFSGITKSTEATDPLSEPSQNDNDADFEAGERGLCSSRAPSPRTPCSELAAGTVQESDERTPNASSNNISVNDDGQPVHAISGTSAATDTKEPTSAVENSRTSYSPELSPLEGTSSSNSAPASSSLPTHQTTPATPDAPGHLGGTPTTMPGYSSGNPMHPGAAPFFPPAYPGPYYAQAHQNFNPCDQTQNLYPHWPQQYYSLFFPGYNNFGQMAPEGPIGGQFPPTASGASLKNGPLVSESDSLMKHLLQNFNDVRFSDVVLHITHKDNFFKPIDFHLHKIMMARSEALTDLIERSTGSHEEGGKLHVKLEISSRFVTPASLETALRVCYGESVMSFIGSHSQDYPEGSKEQMVADMTESIALAVTGNILKLKNVVLRGLEAAVMHLGWANLEHAISFAMESCDFRKHSSESTAVPLADSSQSGIKFTNRPEHDLHPQNTRDLLLICLRFIDRHCPSSWTLDEHAKPLPHVDRLQCLPETRHPGKRSRFAKIKFGQRASYEDEENLEIKSLVSSIVLSLPFDELSSFLQLNAGNEGQINDQMKAIVEERERRRKRVFESEKIDWMQRRLAKDLEWKNVGYEESMIEDDFGDISLHRTECSIYRTATDVAVSGGQDNVDVGN